MTQLLVKNFLRSRGLMFGLLLLFITGLMSLYIGKVFLQQQTEIIEQSAEFQSETHQQNLKYQHGEIGLLLYYIRFGLANETPALAGLSIGHRDIHPNVLSVNIRNLEEQRYSSELVNPLYQLLGNMDFSFVLIYLFPLIIIAFCFNLLSEEKEGGTWRLVLSQSENPLQIIRTKLGIRLVSVLLVLFALLGIGKIYLNIPFDAAFFAYALTAMLYVGFWFALAWLVISLQKASNQNALLLLLSWVLLTIVIPASINALIINLYPVPEAYSTILESRDGYHTKWDLPKEPTIEQFKEIYPQYSKYEHPEDQSFSWFWYFAMQHAGDVQATEATQDTKGKLALRDKISRRLGYFFPTMHTQFALNAHSRSDMQNYLNFMNQIEDFHEAKRLYFYPRIFDDSPIEAENWEDFKLETYQDRRSVDWLASLLPLVILSFLLIFWANTKW